MDEQLKRRLLGAGILSVLAVVIVPYFFEDKAPRTATELPLPVETQALSLPKEEPSAEKAPAEVAPETHASPQAQAGKKRAYTVVSLEDPQAKAVEPAPEENNRASVADEYVEESQSEPNKAPVILDPKAPHPVTKPSLSPKLRHPVGDVPAARTSQDALDAPRTQPKKPEAVKPVKPTVPVQPQEAVSKKPVTVQEPAKKVASPGVAQDAQKKSTPPVSASGSAKPTVPSTYLVQAGTFSDENNAKVLVDKLKKRSLPARLQVVEGLNGKVYRVTVGPNLDHGRAEQIQKQLSEQDGVRGLILQSR